MFGFHLGYSDQQRKQLASLLIRLGLVVVFTYAAIDALRHPDAWIGFVPSFMERFVSLKLALDVISIAQLFLAAWLLIGKYVTYAALISIMFLAGIVFIDLSTFIVTFRDIAIITAAMALIVLEAK